MRWDGKMCRTAGGLWLAGLLLSSSPAQAQDFPAPTNQDYTLDLYQGSAIGSSKIVGMGGVSAATAQGSSGMLTNPAAAGVRPTTSNETWDWDWHFITQTPSIGQDSDNNGIDDDDLRFQPNFTVGVVLQYKDWGLGFTLFNQSVENSFEDGMDAMGEPIETVVDTTAQLSKLSLAHYILDGQIVIGAGARIVSLVVSNVTDPMDSVPLAEIAGTSFEAGAIWKPNRRSFRLGGTISLPVKVKDVAVDNCDPLDCVGYVLPRRMKAPWVASIGFAGRRAPTKWNIRVKSKWRDEKALLWGVDLVMTGKTHKGFGLEAFGQHQLQPSGRKVSLSLRGGAEYEWVPGVLRMRGGSYFEPNRYKDPEGKHIPGRLHLTGGLDWRFWQFNLWGNTYRPQLSVWGDVADKYNVGGLSIGFWH